MGRLRQFTTLTLTALLACVGTLPAVAGERKVNDQVENLLELSDAAPRMAKGQFVAVPIPMANPTLGTGLQGALLYLHAERPNDSSPAATSGLVGMYTDSKSWAIGAFHDNAWLNDRIRFRAAMGKGVLNLRYYLLGIRDRDLSIPYQIETVAFTTQLLGRLHTASRWFAGLDWIYADSDINYGNSQSTFDVIPLLNAKLSGAGPVLQYDSRDDKYYPASGIYFKTSWHRFDEAIDSDFNYDNIQSFANGYFSFTPQLTLAGRVNVERSGKQTPFFIMPMLDIRGIPRDRYRDLNVASLHSELRYKFSQRWGVVGFAELGAFGDSFKDLSDYSPVWGIGAGLRWQATSAQLLHLGLDIAYAEDNAELYLRVGEKF